ncbi:MAG: hypothetical protein FWC40_02535 [Proteobacteria bacterium]|nr:hypothetical protein [Pseudomonadota bacterium]
MRKPWLLTLFVLFLVMITSSCQKKSDDTTDAQPKATSPDDVLNPAIDAFSKYAEDMKKLDAILGADIKEGEEDLGAMLAQLAQLEAANTLSEALRQSGMENFSLLMAGETTIDAQECVHIQQGTNREDQFVTENHYAVCPGKIIYHLDIIGDTWERFSH